MSAGITDPQVIDPSICPEDFFHVLDGSLEEEEGSFPVMLP
jgi:hypothetical protein